MGREGLKYGDTLEFLGLRSPFTAAFVPLNVDEIEIVGEVLNGLGTRDYSIVPLFREDQMGEEGWQLFLRSYD